MKERSNNSRRAFIKKAAISTAGAGLATSFTAKSYASILGANDRVNVGIVGFSNRAKNSLIPAFHIHNKELNFRITSVSDIWNRRNWMECVRGQNTKTDAPARVGYNHSVANIMTTTALHTGKKVTFDAANQKIVVS